MNVRAARLSLGHVMRFESHRAEEHLGTEYRPIRETILDTAGSLIARGLA